MTARGRIERIGQGGGVWERFFVPVERDTDEAAAAYLAVTSRRIANRKAAVVLVTAALSLTVINFGANASGSWLRDLLDALGLDGASDSLVRFLTAHPNSQINGLAFWGLMQFVGYVVLPVVVIRLVLRERVADYGVAVRGIWSHGGTYAFLFAVSVPFIVYASTTTSFQEKYPFYNLAPAEDMWPVMGVWWVIYAIQFVALEFFFRGFLVHGLKWRLGFMSVWVMVVPYNMLHFGKPFIEALAAIVGGLVLGTLSLRTKSVWWGAALHIAVAATMDILALMHAGRLF